MDKSRDLLFEAARAIGWAPPDGSLEEIEEYCEQKLDRSFGPGLDRDHAEAGLRAAIEAAHAGNASYAIAGLGEVEKTLHMHAYYF